MRLVTALIGALALLGPATPAGAHVYTFTKNDPIVVPDNSLTVQGFFDLTGMSGRVYKIVVKIHGLTHGNPADLDITLSALGIDTMLMSDVGSGAIAGLELRFDDCATRVPLDGSGGYRPHNHNSGLPDALGEGTSLSDFTGVNPNTTWHLRFTDDTANGVAGTANGVELVIYTDDENLGQKRSVACETPDFDGDGRMDLGVYRETTGQYLYQRSSNAEVTVVDLVPPGQPGGDVAIPADYDGDGVTDLGIFRRASATWFFTRSFSGTSFTAQGGLPTDQPIPTDFDHDGLTDLGIFRPATAEWFWMSSLTGQIQGIQGGVPGLDKPARRP
jgi:hypothetical protein